MFTERLGIRTTLFTYIQEVLGSNLSRDTGYPDVFRGFRQPLQANFRIIPPIGNERFLSNHIIQRCIV
jgi:hypothetical protein